MSTELTTTNDLTTEQIQLIKNTICRGASDSELQLFLYQCRRTKLDPLNRQIYAVSRYDKHSGKSKMAIQVSIDGLRLIAERSGEYEGQTPAMWADQKGNWTDIWLSELSPAGAKVGVYRTGFREALYAVAKFESYAVRGKNGQLNDFWQKMPEVMIAKVAEALALRKAFPQELSGLYTTEEMDQATDTAIMERQESREAAQEVVRRNQKSVEDAIEVSEEQMQIGEDLLHSYTIKIEQCTTVADLMALGKEITPELTNKMVHKQVEALRTNFQQALNKLKQEHPEQPRNTKD